MTAGQNRGRDDNRGFTGFPFKLGDFNVHGKRQLPPVEAAIWGMPLLDVGNTGYDKGKGAKYVMLPPGHKDAVTCTSD